MRYIDGAFERYEISSWEWGSKGQASVNLWKEKTFEKTMCRTDRQERILHYRVSQKEVDWPSVKWCNSYTHHLDCQK